MEEAKIAIIGAGVVGLAIAAELGEEGVFVLERNPSFGLETSSHNSEVVHAGIYYPQGSLKARLCLEGRGLLYEFCGENKIPFRKIGKIIAALNEEEIPGLEELYQRAQGNGVEDVKFISGDEIKRMEPNANGIAGLFSPSTGIVDSYSLMKVLYHKARSSGASFVFNCEVIGIEPEGQGYRIYVKEGQNVSSFFSLAVINCAGLGAERIAKLLGIDTERAGYKTYFLKGDYFSIAPGKWGQVKRLFYPVPKKYGVGIHNCISVDGGERLGPDEYYVEAIDYKVDEEKRDFFYRFAKQYFPFLEPEDLAPEFSGIRPVLTGPGEKTPKMPNDFIIVHEIQRGLPGFINLIGIESPGLTSSLAIARYVRGLAMQFLG